MKRLRQYNLLLYLLAPIFLPLFLWRLWRAPEYRERWWERFGWVRQPLSTRPRIWIHGVSVGEVMAAIPLLRRLQKEYPHYQLVVTTATPTGAHRVREVFGEQVLHVYLPYDYPAFVRRFLDRVQPRLGIIMETEIWPNLYRDCQQRQLPLFLANARISQRSLQGYRRHVRLLGQILEAVTLTAAQGAADAERWRQLGLPAARIEVMGNLKFDSPWPQEIAERGHQLRAQWQLDRPVWVAASTHEGEDELVLDAFAQIRRQFPTCLLVLVPRHPERFEAVAGLIKRRGYRLARRSRQQTPQTETAVYLGDTMGELLLWYAMADVAFVGGSLVAVGGHNLLEPANLGVPVLTGPHTFNFTEIRDHLMAVGAAREVHDAQDLAGQVCSWLADPPARAAAGRAGQQVVEANRGALDRLWQRLRPYLDAAGG